MRTRSFRIFLVFPFFFLLFSLDVVAQFAPQPLITSPIDERQLVTLRGNTHPLAQPQFDIGTAPADMSLNRMLLVLKRSPQQDYALTKLLDDQQDKNSPNYHKWLTPDKFGQRFGATDQDLAIITGWLTAHGFAVSRVSHGRSVIEFSGVESQLEGAFHTQIHQYLVNNQTHWANATDPQIPAALGPAVAGVWTLHDFRKKPSARFSNQHIRMVERGSLPLVTSGGQHALAPGDYATIYNINPLYTAGINGNGATIAVIGRSNFDVTDVQSFRYNLNLAPYTFPNIILDGPDPGNLGGGEEAEALLDSTWSGALAPNAQIDFVLSASTNTTDGVDLSELYAVDNNLGDVMTESFGLCEAVLTSSEITGISALAQQAAAQGITYTVSTGDSGAEGCDNPNAETVATGPVSVNALASTPFNVAVGGTIFNENGNDVPYWNTTNNPTNLSSAKSYIPEDVWNESCVTCTNPGIWAGGGGASTYQAKPNWQFGVAGIPNDKARDLPDVALTAAGHDPYLICYEGSCGQGYFVGISGTSASAPAFAGIMALVVQQYGRQGQADYVIYRLAGGATWSQCNGSNTAGLPASTCIFNDVTLGNDAVPGEQGYGTASAQYQSGVGYDLASGLGSVNTTNLVNGWNSIAFNATNTTLAPNSLSGVHGSAITVDVQVAPSAGSGVPTGDVALQTANQGIASAALTNGSASPQLTNLPGGSYNLVARYGGDSTYAPSSSNSVSVNITPENSSTTLSILTADPSGNFIPFTTGPYGGFVYIRADVTGNSGNGIPTGTVQFLDGNSPLSLNQYGQNSLPLNSAGNTATPGGFFNLALGSHTIKAVYAGDPSFNQSTSTATSVSITQGNSATAVQITGSDSSGTDIAALVNTSSRGAAPTGTVTFYSGNSVLAAGVSLTGGTNPSDGTAQATGFVSSPISGNMTLTATYSGDANYAGSTSPGLAVSPDFTVWSNAGAGIVFNTPGQPSSSGLYVDGTDSFNGTVSFSCSGLPAESKCAFSPASLTLAPASSDANTTITITTTAPQGNLRATRHLRAIWFAGNGLLFASIFVVAGKRKPGRVSKFLAIALVASLLPIMGCGGGGGGSGGSGSGGGGGVPDPGTPVGNYLITMTVTGGGISHTASLTLVVQ